MTEKDQHLLLHKDGRSLTICQEDMYWEGLEPSVHYPQQGELRLAFPFLSCTNRGLRKFLCLEKLLIL